MELTIKQLAQQINAELSGNADLFNCPIKAIVPIKTALKNNVTFITDDKHRASLSESDAGAVITLNPIEELEIPQLIVKNVNKALIQTLNIFAPKLSAVESGIDSTAIIASDVKIGKSVFVGAGVVIETGVEIDSDTIIASGCKIGQNSKIGKNCRIDNNVVIYHNCNIGNNVIIQANTVIGATGFGYSFFDSSHQLIPHIGGVLLEDFVEIGANCCIDRAKFGNTIVGAGTKIDNLVQIAHNVIIGQCCLIAAQVGISGSTKLGNGVVVGGQAGFKDNIEIGNGVMVGAQAGVMNNIPDGRRLAWTPACEWNNGMRIMVHVRRLPQLAEQLKQLSKRIKELETAKDDTN